jgi:hypothetical protein
MYRFFKCNVLGGFRLSDVNRNIKQNDYFYIEDNICATSRAVRAALEKNWMLEVTEKEASQHITIPRQINVAGVQHAEFDAKRSTVAINQSVATPNVSETNEKLESRQASRSIHSPVAKQKEEEKVAIPDFAAVEKSMKTRHEDVMTKGPDEILKSPVEAKKEVPKAEPETEKKAKVVLSDQDMIKDLDKEIDNSLLSVPNFDEKAAKKEELVEDIEKKARRRRRFVEPVPEQKV